MENLITDLIAKYLQEEKDNNDRFMSKVNCDLMRGGSEFSEFHIEINEDGIPEISRSKNISSHYETKTIDF